MGAEQSSSTDRRPSPQASGVAPVPPPASSSSNSANEGGRARATSDLLDVMSWVDMIRNLEEEHRKRLDMISAKRKALNEFMNNVNDIVKEKVSALEVEKEETKRINKELYTEEMEAVGKKKEAELEQLIQHVNTTVLEERRLMMREDVFSLVKRELEDAWEEGVDLMKSEQQAALQKQTAITTTTYNRKFDEFKANLDAEYADALKKHEEAKAASKKRSSGIFSWLSPSNKRRRGGDEEAEEED